MQSDTDDLDIDKFPHHGSVRLHIEDDNTFVYTCTGPFNDLIVSAIQSLHVEYHHRKAGRKEIIVFTESCLGIDSMFDAASIALNEDIATGIHPKAVVLVIALQVEGRNLMLKKYQNVYENTGVPFTIVEDIEAARVWLHQF